jgi:hypothetical protein
MSDYHSDRPVVVEYRMTHNIFLRRRTSDWRKWDVYRDDYDRRPQDDFVKSYL